MNTKNIADRTERKEAKRKARGEAPAKGPRKEARGSAKKKISHMSKGTRKR